MDRIPVTATGLEMLEKERKQLMQIDRPAVIQAIAEAREHGDLSENAEYHAARERQSFIEGRLLELDDMLSRIDVIDPTNFEGPQVRFSATVTLVDEETEEEKTYQIVGVNEANVEAGLISYTSPIAKAMIGKNEGDSIEVTAPGGSKYYEIEKVVYK
ncbi:MAG: transcription elongation factor GreA [Alphaproteobacteria bacterium]